MRNYYQFIRSELCNVPDAVLHLPTPPDVIMEIVNEWLNDGIIIPAKSSAWNLPITVVQKKNLDGSKTDKIRVCLDPRMLNKHLPVLSMALPLLPSIFQNMTNAKVFTTLDLKSVLYNT
ncbi:hypothetical protein BDB01DRAFT_855893 [Pilobolus umbonatus]|nr:hypothetical protein BDB01DRAFT_855893 [Pilobolus umbonatus]